MNLNGLGMPALPRGEQKRRLCLNASDLKPYIIQKFCIHSVNHMIEEGRSTIMLKDVAAVEALVLSDEAAPPQMRSAIEHQDV